LTADFGTQSLNFPGLADWASRFFNAGPTLQLPIFEGGRLKATVRLNDVREQELAVTYAKTVVSAVHEVENAVVALQNEEQRHASLESTVGENRIALDIARERYAGGVTTFLDVLDAERTLQQNESTLAGSTSALSADAVALYKALGGGWQQPPELSVVTR
jgi:outer membrane protein TolC